MSEEKITNMPWWLQVGKAKNAVKYSVKYDNPKKPIRTHWHDYIEFQIVTGGSGKMTFNGVTYDMSRGDVFVLSHFDCHRIDPEKTGVEITTINVAHGFLDDRTSDFLNTSGGGIYCRVDEDELGNILYQCKKLYNDMESDAPIVVYSSKIAISGIVMLLLRKNSISSGQIPHKMQKITSYINNNFTQDMTLESIAKEFETSANYLGKQFKNLLGITYNDYINRVRMRYACNLISSTEMTIKEVAHAAGYSSTEYFYSVFKKHIGVTPLKYRKERFK